MSSKHTYQITVAGAVEFSAATAITNFNEIEALNTMPDNVVARLHTISYNSSGDPHEVNLSLSPAVGAAAEDQIPIRIATATAPATTPPTLNRFLIACGEDGTLVPRQTGLINVPPAQAPTVAWGSPGTSYVLLFSTSGKTGDGVLTITYSIGDRSPQ